MWQRIKGFASRHRKKLIGGGILIGGAYVAWKVLAPRLQDMAMQRLLKELEELANQGGDENLAEDSEKAAAESREARRRAKFEHLQEVCDTFAQKRLAPLRDRHYSLFAVAACTENIQKAQSKDEKMARLRDLQVEVLARETSLLSAMHAMLLLRRVMFNIAGRVLAGDSDGLNDLNGSVESESPEETSLFAYFLDLSQAIEAEACATAFASAARKAVEAKCEAEQLQPTTSVDANMLRDMLIDMCLTVQKELLTGAVCVDTLLPDSLDASSAPDVGKVQQLLDEARDYLESPQFLLVHQALVRQTIVTVVDSLTDETSGGACLAQGQSCPLAKLMGRLMSATKSDEAFMGRLCSEEAVRELCEAVYSSTCSPTSDAQATPPLGSSASPA